MPFCSGRITIFRTYSWTIRFKNRPNKGRKLKKTKFPTTKKEVRQFLGLAGYFRDFIKDYEEIAAPLTNLTKDTTTGFFELSTNEKEAATTLINKISEYPV